MSLKFFHEYFSSPIIVDEFNLSYQREVLKNDRNVVIAKFLGEQLWSGTVLLENDLHSLGMCFDAENIKRLQNGKRSHSEKLYMFIEKRILKKLTGQKVYSLQELIESIEEFFLENMKVS
mmetsp:Transcript_25859/g.25128  ORF Transcript_25859/g.25128 Transcript_25859/m.25128 type:complete len:120 (-) Transcript_25859:1768-2127(-)